MGPGRAGRGGQWRGDRRAASAGRGALRGRPDRVSAPLGTSLRSVGVGPGHMLPRSTRRSCIRSGGPSPLNLPSFHESRLGTRVLPARGEPRASHCWAGGRTAKAAPVCLGEKVLIPLIQQLADWGATNGIYGNRPNSTEWFWTPLQPCLRPEGPHIEDQPSHS